MAKGLNRHLERQLSFIFSESAESRARKETARTCRPSALGRDTRIFLIGKVSFVSEAGADFALFLRNLMQNGRDLFEFRGLSRK